MGWLIEISRTLGYALAISLVFVFLRTMIGFDNTKATGWGVVRAQGYGIMLVGFFTVVFGFLLTRVDFVAGPNGRAHFMLR
jgi:hypothetical protein